jgi:hypothetical protein
VCRVALEASPALNTQPQLVLLLPSASVHRYTILAPPQPSSPNPPHTNIQHKACCSVLPLSDAGCWFLLPPPPPRPHPPLRPGDQRVQL